MPEAVRFVTRKKKKKLGFSVRFELEIKGRKSVFVIGEFYNKTEQKPLHRNKPPVIGYRNSTDNRSTVDRLFALADVLFGSDSFPYPDNTVNY